MYVITPSISTTDELASDNSTNNGNVFCVLIKRVTNPLSNIEPGVSNCNSINACICAAIKSDSSVGAEMLQVIIIEPVKKTYFER